MRAIELREEGKKVKEIAHFFGLHPASVSRWFVSYRREGKKALKSKKSIGRPSRMNMKETCDILNLLKKPATDYGFPTALWTCKRVRQLIQKKLHKKFTDVGIWKFLKRFGLTNKKPQRKAIEQDKEKVKKWIKEIWPEILEKAKKWQAIIYFHDECGVSLVPVLGKTWAPKGKIPVVEVTGKKGGFVISSMISTGGRLLFRIEKEKITKEVFIDFLKKVIFHHHGRKIIIITDNAPPHIANAVKEFAELNKKSFALYYLPSYSPELNCDEHVWEYLKNKKLKNHTATSVKDLKKLTLSSMCSIQKQKPLLKSFLYGELFNTS